MDAAGAFTGNPAAVCLLPAGATPSDGWRQAVAAEMNLSETAFVERREAAWAIRWMTPEAEVDLCGHATLASAHALYEEGLVEAATELVFASRSGPLRARRLGRADDAGRALLELDFPATAPAPAEAPPGLLEALGVGEALTVARSRFDVLVQLADEAAVRALEPDLRRLRAVDARGVIVTAAGDAVDLVSRFFAPAVGVDEDPVTGSAHCALAPFWAERLGRKTLRARQLSRRGGRLELELVGERVKLRGAAVTTLRGELTVPLD